MNEQIKELAEQARLLTGWPVGEIEYQKFAELIIKKCRDIVSDTRELAIEDDWNVDEAMSTAMFDIEVHFGVGK
jgi:hypothetical protein